MSCLTLPAVLILALSIHHGSAQVPANSPPCVQTCANVKVSEGYCSSSAIFTAAYTQCLRDNCNAADITTGTPFANSICGAAGTNVTSPAAGNNGTTPVAGTNGTTNSTAPVPVAPGNVTANGTDYAATVNNALRAAGLGTLATLLSSPAGAGFVSQLQQGNHTVFAPSDSALASVPLNSTSPADLNALLQYHVIPGALDVSRLPPTGHGIVRSALRGTPYVNLPANDSQVLVLTRQPNGSIEINEPTRNITVSNFTRVANLELAVVPTLLTIPGTIGTTAAGVPELSTLVGIINGTAPQLFSQLDQTPGLTIFAPINSALANVPQNTNYQAIFLNHIVNGSVLYSTTIANTTNVRSAGGADIEFSSNGTGTFARSGNRTIQVIQADIVTRTGVIHLVSGLFDPSNSTPTFPLVNTNNSTETLGITQVDGANSSTAQNAAQSPALRVLPPSSIIGIISILTIVGASQLMGF